jgi:hypothetical protein
MRASAEVVDAGGELNRITTCPGIADTDAWVPSNVAVTVAGAALGPV